MAAFAGIPRATRPAFLYWAAALCIAAVVVLRPIPVVISRDLLAQPGQQLLHPELGQGLWTYSMPGPSLLASLDREGIIFRVIEAFQLPVLLCALLAFSLGCELASLPAGAVAAALSIMVMVRSSPLNLEQLLLADGLLLAGALLAAPSERPRLKDAAVGAAIAASLLVRGVLAPFPAIAALCGAFFGERPRRVLARGALFALAPLLVVLVWGFVQRGENGRFEFLEWSGTRADSNLISGALGLTGTVEGDAYGLAGVSRRGGVLAWAAGEIARHPARFAAALARRIARTAALSPFLFLAGLAGAFRCARRADFAPVAALAGYFLLFHCLMGVEERYFLPFWLLACPLAASCLGAIPAARVPAPRTAPVAWLCFIPIAAAAAGVLGLLLRFPWVERSERGFALALEKTPADPALWLLRGIRELKQGRADRARSDFETSYRLGGQDSALFGLLLSAFARGPRDAALVFAPDQEELRFKFSLLKALVRLEQGRDGDARAALARARVLWTAEKAYVRDPVGRYEEEQQAALRADDTMLINDCFNTIFFAMPKSRRLALARRLPRLGFDPLAPYDRFIARFPRNQTFLHDRGVVNVMLGRWGPAVADLEAAIALDPDFKEAYLSLAAAHAEAGDPAGAAAVKRALLARPGLPDSLRRDLLRDL